MRDRPPLNADAPSTGSAPIMAHSSETLYVGDLHPDIAENTLYEIFTPVGPVQSIRVCRDVVTRSSLGYAYVNFSTQDDAERALTTMNYYSSALTRDKPLRLMWKIRDPSARKSGTGNIFVKNLNHSVDNRMLYELFTVFGNILSYKVAAADNGKSLGYGFVHFESDAAATIAVKNADGLIVAGRKINVSKFLNKKEREEAGQSTRSFTNVYVKNVPEAICNEDGLRELFSVYGEITSMHVPRHDDGVPKGFAFVNFKSPYMAQKCVAQMNECEADENALVVRRAQTRQERQNELRSRDEQHKLRLMQKNQGANLYVKNLTDDIDDDRLHEEFSKYGTILSVKVMRDEKQNSRGFGFVNFTQPEEATRAVTELNGRIISTKPLFVALAQRKDVRKAYLEARRAARTSFTATQSSVPFMPSSYQNLTNNPQHHTTDRSNANSIMTNPYYLSLGQEQLRNSHQSSFVNRTHTSSTLQEPNSGENSVQVNHKQSATHAGVNGTNTYTKTAQNVQMSSYPNIRMEGNNIPRYGISSPQMKMPELGEMTTSGRFPKKPANAYELPSSGLLATQTKASNKLPPKYGASSSQSAGKKNEMSINTNMANGTRPSTTVTKIDQDRVFNKNKDPLPYDVSSTDPIGKNADHDRAFNVDTNDLQHLDHKSTNVNLIVKSTEMSAVRPLNDRSKHLNHADETTGHELDIEADTANSSRQHIKKGVRGGLLKESVPYRNNVPHYGMSSSDVRNSTSRNTRAHRQGREDTRGGSFTKLGTPPPGFEADPLAGYSSRQIDPRDTLHASASTSHFKPNKVDVHPLFSASEYESGPTEQDPLGDFVGTEFESNLVKTTSEDSIARDFTHMNIITRNSTSSNEVTNAHTRNMGKKSSRLPKQEMDTHGSLSRHMEQKDNTHSRYTASSMNSQPAVQQFDAYMFSPEEFESTPITSKAELGSISRLTSDETEVEPPSPQYQENHNRYKSGAVAGENLDGHYEGRQTEDVMSNAVGHFCASDYESTPQIGELESETVRNSVSRTPTGRGVTIGRNATDVDNGMDMQRPIQNDMCGGRGRNEGSDRRAGRVSYPRSRSVWAPRRGSLGQEHDGTVGTRSSYTTTMTPPYDRRGTLMETGNFWRQSTTQQHRIYGGNVTRRYPYTVTQQQEHQPSTHVSSIDDAWRRLRMPAGDRAEKKTKVGSIKSPERQMLFDELVNSVAQRQPTLANKITCMLVDELETADLYRLLDSPSKLNSRVDNYVELLRGRAAGPESDETVAEK